MSDPVARLGSPRHHYEQTDSTNRVARELAADGAPHGTLVTADAQSAGRGRQGRAWTAPAGSSLLMSLVVREPPPLLSLIAGIAVAQTVDAVTPAAGALIKWPNDVLVSGRKVAGILVEGRPQERWAVLGIGLNVAVRVEEFPPELQQRAGTLGLTPNDVERVLAGLLQRLEQWLLASEADLIAALSTRDYLRGRHVEWDAGSGTAAGIDAGGGLIVELAGGATTVLDAGEVHLRSLL